MILRFPYPQDALTIPCSDRTMMKLWYPKGKQRNAGHQELETVRVHRYTGMVLSYWRGPSEPREDAIASPKF